MHRTTGIYLIILYELTKKSKLITLVGETWKHDNLICIIIIQPHVCINGQIFGFTLNINEICLFLARGALNNRTMLLLGRAWALRC